MTSDFFEHPLSTRLVYDGKLLRVREDQVQLPNGKESRREYIQHPGAAVVIPLLDSGEVLLERQFRYPLGREFIELPAGKIDPDEEPLETAKRELEEETGYQAEKWDFVTTMYPCIGYSNERLLFYVARSLRQVGHRRDEDELLEIFSLPLDQALQMVRRGEICEAKTVTGLFWLEKLRGEWKDLL